MADKERRSTPRIPLSLTHLGWLIPITAIGIALRLPIRDNSYLWHVRAGELQMNAGSVLTQDPFSFTAGGLPWRTQSWLMDIFYGWFERFGALASADIAVLVSAVVLLAAVGLRLARRPGGLMAPLGLVWVMWITLGYFTARPVFPSLALFGVLTLVADDPRLRWTIGPLFWVWASLHGGFIVGIGYLVLQALRTRDRRWMAAAAVAALAVTLTAHGWGTWEVLWRFATSRENLDLIVEWRPPDFVSVALLPFLVGIVGLLIGGMNGRFSRQDLWLVIPFLLFAFTANRSVPLAAIALAPFVMPKLDRIRIGSTPLAPPAAWTTVILILALPWVLPIEEAGLEQRFPVEATEHLEDRPTFHDDGVGGYLIYRGRREVFVDDRAELYGDIYADALAARDAEPGWEALFEEHDISQALLQRSDAVVEVLEAGGWVTAYEDEDFIVLLDPDVSSSP